MRSRSQVVRGQQRRAAGRGTRARGGAAGIEAHPHEATPSVDLHRSEADVRRHRLELVGVDDLDQLAVEVVSPGMVATPNAARRRSDQLRRRDECHGAGTCCGRPERYRGPTARRGSTGRRSGTRRSRRPRRSLPLGRPPARRVTRGARIPAPRIRRSCNGREGRRSSSPIKTRSRSMSLLSAQRSAKALLARSPSLFR